MTTNFDGTVDSNHDCVVDRAIEEYRNGLKMKMGAIPFSRVQVTNFVTHVTEDKAVLERSKVINLL